MTSLPGGRGSRLDSGSFIDQMESYAERERGIPATNGTIITPMHSLTHANGTSATGSMSSGTTRFIALTPQPYDVVVTEARMRVTFGRANTAAGACLYQVDKTRGTNVLRKIAPAAVRFNTGSTSIVTAKLAQPVRIPARTLLFMAAYVLWVGSGPTVSVVAIGGANQIFSVYYIDGTEFPAELESSSLIEQSTTVFPYVAYLSPDIAEVL